MEQRYGKTQVCSVGTYTTMQMKSLLKDFGRQNNLNIVEMNFLTKSLDLGEDTVETVTDLFKNSIKNPRLKKFIQKNVDLVNTINLCLKQPKAESIHACATIVVPNEKEIFDWIPVKKMSLKDGTTMLVSEWEGNDLDECGFLKEDILGITQLDKFRSMIDSIKKESGDVIDIYNIPLEDNQVYQYFMRGWNGDIFHFGSIGLTEYCRSLMPKDIEELIAGIALYRPGPMENGTHNEYILLKEGNRTPHYDYGLEEVTKNTFGLYIYQEQVMKTCQVLGGFTLMESDGVRKALGKKKQDIIDGYKGQFIENAIKRGCPIEESKEIWSKLEKFAKYGLNRSHAASYAVTGYIGQWLKVHYPVHFWTTAFKFDKKQEKTARYVSEINKTGKIKLMPPNINSSQKDFYTDFNTNSMYWGLTSVKFCGDIAVEQLEQDKLDNGGYFDFNEFLSRNKYTGSKINKRILENLILCGAFDDIEQISEPKKRKRLLIDLYHYLEFESEDDANNILNADYKRLNNNWWWLLQQRILCGLGFFKHKALMETRKFPNPIVGDIFFSQAILKESVASISGYILDMEVKRSKKNGEYAKLVLESNYDLYPVTIWFTEWKKFKEELAELGPSILMISGAVTYDSYKNQNTLFTNKGSKIMILN